MTTTPAATVRITVVDHQTIRVQVGDQRFLVESSCPHRGGRLRFAHVNPRTLRLTCPLHHASFDLLTGYQTGGPACRPLNVRPDPETSAGPTSHSAVSKFVVPPPDDTNLA
jgi:nitrite reductase/ring-hydroxylating ferredoxin subunit